MRRISPGRLGGGLAALFFVPLAPLVFLGALVTCSAEDVAGEDGGSPGGSARAEEEYIHPDFALTGGDLAEMTAELPESLREQIGSDPLGFLEALGPVLETDPDFLRLVDKDHPLTPDYEPDDLVSLDGTGLSVSRSGHRLRRAILIDLNRDRKSTRLNSSHYS